MSTRKAANMFNIGCGSLSKYKNKDPEEFSKQPQRTFTGEEESFTSLPAPEPMTQVPTLLVPSPPTIATITSITFPVPETSKRKGKRNSKKTSFCVSTSEHLGTLKAPLEAKEQKIINIQQRQDFRSKKREEKLRADNEKLQVAKVKANGKKLSQT